jgi:two-component system sensor histidine kinase HydH
MPLHEVVAQSIALLRVEAERAHVTLEVHPAVTDVEVSIDPLQIEQVLLNVILNAIQATPPTGRVVVREDLTDRDVRVDVIDEGPGIAADHLSSIFLPFFTTRDTGTGLGLAIAQRIVLSHAGRLEVARTSPRGTCFRISLPVGTPRGSGRQPSDAVIGV